MRFKGLSTRGDRQPQKPEFTHSLVGSVLVVLLLAALFPILLIGTINHFRSRDLLLEQASTQIKRIVQFQAGEVERFVSQQRSAMDKLAGHPTFAEYGLKLLTAPPQSDDYLRAKNTLYYSLRANPLTNPIADFDRLIIVRPDGTVAFASDSNWANENFNSGRVESAEILTLAGQQQAVLTYSPIHSYKYKMVLLSSQPIQDEDGRVLATIVAFTAADTINRSLANASTFVSGGRMYYFFNSGTLISVDQQGQSAAGLTGTEVGQALKSLVASGRTNRAFASQSFESVPVQVYGEWLPEYQVGVVLEVSQPVVLRSNNLFDPFNLALLAGSFLVCGGLIYFSSRRWVSPLLQLAQVVNQFSQGNWAERSKVNRSDEIGLLSHSFNNMADELSEMYRSLEAVIHKRTSQLRSAAEIAQQVTSTASAREMLSQAAALIHEKFGYDHAAVYRMDPGGRFLTLEEAGGLNAEAVKQRGGRFEVNEGTLIGSAAANNQARIITDLTATPLYRPHELLPGMKAEAVIPIALGSEVMGVLDLQSADAGAFDENTISVFTTLTNQLSSNLHTSRLLESTRVSYLETSILYRATQQVTQAHSEHEIMQSLSDAFLHLPWLGLILSLEEDVYKVLAVTDPQSGRIDSSLLSLTIPASRSSGLLVENRVILIEDVARPSAYDNILAFLVRRGCASAALVSVLENGRLSKVIVLGAQADSQLSYTNLQPYANLAEVIGASLEKHRVLTVLQKRLAELQVLTSFSQAISAEMDLNQLYRVLHQQVIQTLGSDLDFTIGLYDEQAGLIEFPYVFDSGQMIGIDPIPYGEGLASSVLMERKPLLLANQRAIQAHAGNLLGRAAKSWMGVPLLFAGSAVGAVILQDLQTENRFDQDDLSLFMTLAPQIATAIRNSQLYTETQQALQAYDQERFLLNTLLENIPDSIAYKDTQGHYIRVSRSLAQMYNLSPEETAGKTDFDLMDPAAAKASFEEEQAVLRAGEPEFDHVYSRTAPDGTLTWVHAARLPIRTGWGDLYGLLLIERDITDLKQAEALAQRQAAEIRTAAEIARDTTGLLDAKMLLQKCINLVRERFGFYHASIFLIDSAGEYAVLRESTGSAGLAMMQAGHRLAVGSRSIVGQVTASGQALIVNDVDNDPTHLPNPLLPDTRSELALPLSTTGRILGALDVQSNQTGAFSEGDVNVLQVLADQLAVALVNGELFARTQELLNKHRLLRQLTISASATGQLDETLTNVVDGLSTAVAAERVSVFLLANDGLLQIQAAAGYEGTGHLQVRLRLGEGIPGQCAKERRNIRVEEPYTAGHAALTSPSMHSELAVPILFRDELIGVLDLQSTWHSAFDENDQEILTALGSNLGGVIANARLVNQVRQQVARERQLFDVTSKIRQSVDLGAILQTSTQEICRALGARSASIQITAGSRLLDQDRLPEQDLLLEQADEAAANGHKNGQERGS